MDNRETQLLDIKGHTLTVKTYATAREAATIQQAYFKGAKVEINGQEPKISEFNPGVQFEVQLELIRQMVLDLDGSSDRIAERAEQLPNDVFDEITRTLDALVAKKKS